MHQLYTLIKYGVSATKHKLYDQIGAKGSNYCKIDKFGQSENVSVFCNAQIHTHIYLN